MEKSCIAKFDDEKDMNMEATELRLGLPGSSCTHSASSTPHDHIKMMSNKRVFPSDNKSSSDQDTSPPSKAQVVGWPPIRSYRKNIVQAKKSTDVEVEGMFVKVSMDGAPYLRKIDLKMYKTYPQLLKALQDLFHVTLIGDQCSPREGYKKNNNGSEFVSSYKDKDGDWMLLGDVPWEMFMSSCKRLRIMKASEVRGLSCAV